MAHFRQCSTSQCGVRKGSEKRAKHIGPSRAPYLEERQQPRGRQQPEIPEILPCRVWLGRLESFAMSPDISQGIARTRNQASWNCPVPLGAFDSSRAQNVRECRLTTVLCRSLASGDNGWSPCKADTWRLRLQVYAQTWVLADSAQRTLVPLLSAFTSPVGSMPGRGRHSNHSCLAARIEVIT